MPSRQLRLIRSLVVLLLLVAVAALAVNALRSRPDGPDDGVTVPEPTTSPSGPDDTGPTAPPPPPCPETAEVDATDLTAAAGGTALTAVEVVTGTVRCVEQVVVLAADADPALAAVAAAYAAGVSAVVLTGEPTADLLAAIGDPEVIELPTWPPTNGDATPGGDDGDGGGADGPDADGTRTDDATDDADDGGATSGDAVAQALADLAVELARETGANRLIAAPAGDAAALATAVALAARTGDGVLPVAGDGPLTVPADLDLATVGDAGPLADRFPDRTLGQLDADRATAPDADDAVTWLVDPSDPAAATVLTVAALRDEAVVPVTGGDVLARATVRTVRDAGLTRDRLVAVGSLQGEHLDDDLDLLADAPLLPGGTLRLFDGTRMVALYGKPGVPALGVLGEQELEETFARAREVTEGYDGDGRETIPTLEVIATVAARAAGPDGNYSDETPAEELRELVDRAGEEGVQVVIDLQPGRTDFLTQAQLYEDLLREPHVGLALDPEWRLRPNQVHLRQIGSVEAAEVQQVVDWLAELTREEGLSQKLLILHQFRLSMLPDRDTIELPREIAGLIHADGQGPQPAKHATWRVLTAQGADQWWWGWKNFYDEDPTLATPEEVLALEPEVVFVSFQ